MPEGTPSTMQSIGSPMYWREVTNREHSTNTITYTVKSIVIA